MTILNRKLFPFLFSEGSSNKPTMLTHSIVFEMGRRFNDANYWYVEYKFNNSFIQFPIESYIPENIQTRIRNKEIFLFLVNFHESFPDSVRSIYTDLIIPNNLPPEQIILGSGNPDMINEVRKACQELSQSEIKVDWFLELEYAAWEQKYRQKGTTHRLDTLQIKDYPKKFLNFNRRWRMHRPTAVALMATKGLLEKGYVSLGTSDDNRTWENILNSIYHYHKENSKLEKIFRVNKDLIKSIPPLYLDTTDLVTNRSFIEPTTDYLYENTYFSLVSETNYYTDPSIDSRGRFITEKTFKCIAQEHPFILLAPPHTLPLLHKLGYKTFSPLIDESYDSEEDDSIRMLKVVNEVKRLSNLSNEELTEFLKIAKEICCHNYDNLMSKKNFIYKVNY